VVFVLLIIFLVGNIRVAIVDVDVRAATLVVDCTTFFHLMAADGGDGP